MEYSTLLVAMCTGIVVYYLSSKTSKPEPVKAPTVKFISSFAPEFISRLLFNPKASTVIYSGYQKVFGVPYRTDDHS